jgi:hypothetical protein
MVVYFAQMKYDQFGERLKDPRHIYGNPLNPEICPVQALGIFWACIPMKSDQNRLFEGSQQYDRFREIFQRLLKSEQVSSVPENIGKQSADFGTHSFRKGAVTYAGSGSTACPSAVAVSLRAGWALAGVQGTYMRYQEAGDQVYRKNCCRASSGPSRICFVASFLYRSE